MKLLRKKIIQTPDLPLFGFVIHSPTIYLEVEAENIVQAVDIASRYLEFNDLFDLDYFYVLKEIREDNGMYTTHIPCVKIRRTKRNSIGGNTYDAPFSVDVFRYDIQEREKRRFGNMTYVHQGYIEEPGAEISNEDRIVILNAIHRFMKE